MKCTIRESSEAVKSAATATARCALEMQLSVHAFSPRARARKQLF